MRINSLAVTKKKHAKNIFFSFLGITTVLTLSTIALESRTDLPKVHYATALDWFIICSFGYCIATLLEFAGVHYFTKVKIHVWKFKNSSVTQILCEIKIGKSSVSKSAILTV